jgi:hypothetical protein
MRLFVVALIVVSAVLGAPSRVAAQGESRQKLANILPDLYLDATISEALAFFFAFDDLFETDVLIDAFSESTTQRLSFVGYVNGLAGNQLSSFPLGSASGGFTWTFDPASAALTRSSNSFGPIFAERPLTIGRRRLNVGTNYQRVTFDHIDGRRLRGGEIVGYFGQMFDQFGSTDRFGVFFADSLDVIVTTDTVNAFATFGLTDRMDIGVAVPFSRVDLRATLTSRVGNTITGVDEDPVFVTSRSGTASGLGDMVIRAKYNILKRDSVAIAESVDVRLPTGDEEDLLGVAGPQIKLTFIASSAWGRLSPHVNFAYTIAGTSALADDPEAIVAPPPEEINYVGGADLALSLRTTLAVDAVGRILRGAGTLTWAPTQFGPQFQQFRPNVGEDLHLLLGSVGVKVNPFGNLLLTTNVLFPLIKNGLTDKLTWMAGFDYSF